jgi:hypothetical protein
VPSSGVASPSFVSVTRFGGASSFSFATTSSFNAATDAPAGATTSAK